MQKMAKRGEVFPKLSKVTFGKLPKLISICEGIDFKDLQCEVKDCPKYQETNQIQEEPKSGDSENQATASVSQEFAESIDIISKERVEGGPNSEDVVAATMVADLAPRNSSEALIIPHQKEFPLDLKPSQSRSEISMKRQEELADRMIIGVISSVVSQVRHLQFGPSKLVASTEETHEQGSQEDDAAEEVPIIVQSTDSDSRKQTRVSPISAQITQSIKDTTERGLEKNYVEDDVVAAVGSTNSDSGKQSTGPIDDLSGKHSALSAKEKEKGIDEKATATDTSQMATPFIRALTVKEAGDHSNVQEEAIIHQAIPSLHHQSQIAYASTSSPKLGICEIFKLVDLKQGETALLAEALERYPQLLLPREHRTHRIIALSYRVLVDILVMLATKTPCTISTSEKSTLEANLSEAIVLGFDKDWVESVRAKVFGVDMSDISAAKAKIQAMEVKLGEIDSQLSGLSEHRKKLIQNMTMFSDIVNAKDKPFGI
ncbi:uncharacterized protein LOC114743524 isoform X5 [Neltuma alba]|uniref:uncharacterized protein LOC114743524 isoform X5 n=1 Tax=Neltuma alba TaxID=207710 RepID=UPI0010A3F145|nr:uncharacterized protein LOC114743524 isoform X5 [Prosopis alba]